MVAAHPLTGHLLSSGEWYAEDQSDARHLRQALAGSRIMMLTCLQIFVDSVTQKIDATSPSPGTISQTVRIALRETVISNVVRFLLPCQACESWFSEAL